MFRLAIYEALNELSGEPDSKDIIIDVLSDLLKIEPEEEETLESRENALEAFHLMTESYGSCLVDLYIQLDKR